MHINFTKLIKNPQHYKILVANDTNLHLLTQIFHSGCTGDRQRPRRADSRDDVAADPARAGRERQQSGVRPEAVQRVGGRERVDRRQRAAHFGDGRGRRSERPRALRDRGRRPQPRLQHQRGHGRDPRGQEPQLRAQESVLVDGAGRGLRQRRRALRLGAAHHRRHRHQRQPADVPRLALSGLRGRKHQDVAGVGADGARLRRRHAALQPGALLHQGGRLGTLQGQRVHRRNHAAPRLGQGAPGRVRPHARRHGYR